MKMTFFRNKFSKALKHPKPALDYVFRVWKLSKFLPEYKQEIRGFFKEAGKVRDSKEVLPRILSELKSVDIFMHGSAHTYEYMSFEFRTAWRHIRKGGVLLSDDIYLNKAFEDFIKEVNPTHISTFALLGALRK